MEKICLLTYGCSLNKADSEIMTASLEKKGFQIIKSIDDSDLVIINSCAVKGPTESKFFTLLEKLKEMHKKVVIAGCMAQAMPEKLKDYSKIGIDQLESIGDVVDETINTSNVSLLVREKKNKLRIESSRENPYLEIIPISSGCLGDCSYCITKKARGELYSYPAEDIIEKIKKAINEGVKEIYLTSQDTGCWGFDIGSNLAKLLKKVSSIPGDHMIRVGMANPNNVLKFKDELIESFKSERIYKFLHLPIQSANNYVLEDMNRQYMLEDYLMIINAFRKAFPELVLSTDLIVGYPTETEGMFKDSIKFIKEVKPDALNLSKFWPRPHTKAYKLKPLNGNIVKQRAIIAMDTFKWTAHDHRKRWKNWEGDILITEKGKFNTYIGRNKSYKQIIINQDVEIGKWYRAKATDTTIYDIRADIITKY